jgi:hypothetical protein
MLIVVAKNPLLNNYGSLGYGRIRVGLNTWAEVDGDHVIAVDDADEMQGIGLEAVTNDPVGIQWAIQSIARKYPWLVPSILVVGGGSIVPFIPLPNPVQDRSIDPDYTVLSDNPYGALVDSPEEQLAPSRPVGRLVVPDQATVDDFVNLVEAFPHLSNPQPVGQQGSALVVNEDWADYSRKVAEALPDPMVWHLAPGYEMNAATREDAARRSIYFNLHGFSGDSDWKCYSETQKSFIPAVTPDGLDRSCVAGAVSFAECCYGAQIDGRTANDSCALKLVQEGASFIGATGLAFGSYIASGLFLEDADFLARAFFQRLGGGDSLGSALRTARKLYLNDSVEARSGDVWQYKQKTLLQFVLFGNPQLVP